MKLEGLKVGTLFFLSAAYDNKGTRHKVKGNNYNYIP